MDLFGAVAPLNGALDYHLERHSVLIGNVSNIDTPGYVAKELTRTGGSFDSALNLAMSKTQDGHFALGASQVTTGVIINDPSGGGGADNNKVSLDREAAKVAANQLRYDVISTIVTSELADLSYAAADGRGV